jgi:hypothetical protein
MTRTGPHAHKEGFKVYDNDDKDPLGDMDVFRRQQDQQWDSGLNRGEALDGIRPLWDGPYQYLGGVAVRLTSADRSADSLFTERIKTRRRAITRLIRHAPELFPRGQRPFTEPWLSASPPSLRRYLDCDRSFDIDDVTFDLLQRYTDAA